jgi:hypothetical protein
VGFGRRASLAAGCWPAAARRRLGIRTRLIIYCWVVLHRVRDSPPLALRRAGCPSPSYRALPLRHPKALRRCRRPPPDPGFRRHYSYQTGGTRHGGAGAGGRPIRGRGFFLKIACKKNVRNGVLVGRGSVGWWCREQIG